MEKEIRSFLSDFIIETEGRKWRNDPATGKMIRTLLPGGCARLHEVTYTCDPAYQEPSVAFRSMQKAIENEQRKSADWKAEARERMLKLSKLSQG